MRAQAGDAHDRALGLRRGDRPGARPLGERADLLAERAEALRVGGADDRHDEPVVHGHGHADVDGRGGHQALLAPAPREAGMVAERQGARAHDRRGVGEPAARRRTEALQLGREVGRVGLGRQRELGGLAQAGGQAGRDRASHRGQGLGPRGLRAASGTAAAAAARPHVGLDDAPAGPGPGHPGEVHPQLAGEPARGGGRRRRSRGAGRAAAAGAAGTPAPAARPPAAPTSSTAIGAPWRTTSPWATSASTRRPAAGARTSSLTFSTCTSARRSPSRDRGAGDDEPGDEDPLLHLLRERGHQDLPAHRPALPQRPTSADAAAAMVSALGRQYCSSGRL